MNVQPLNDLTPETAQQKYREYLRESKITRDPKDRALKNAFRYAKNGKNIIDIADVIKNAGVNNELYPNLAIARATDKECFFRCNFDGSGEYTEKSWSARKEVFLPRHTFPNDTAKKLDYDRLKTIVPVIPPSLRPKKITSTHYILFEANWKEVPVDPILLKKIYGYIFVVLAHWDLTKIERAVLKVK